LSCPDEEDSFSHKSILKLVAKSFSWLCDLKFEMDYKVLLQVAAVTLNLSQFTGHLQFCYSCVKFLCLTPSLISLFTMLSTLTCTKISKIEGPKQNLNH